MLLVCCLILIIAIPYHNRISVVSIHRFVIAMLLGTKVINTQGLDYIYVIN